MASILDQVLTETQEVVVTREELAAQGEQAGETGAFFSEVNTNLAAAVGANLMDRALVKEQVEATLAQVVSREDQVLWEIRLEKQVLLTRRLQSHAVWRSMLD